MTISDSLRLERVEHGLSRVVGEVEGVMGEYGIRSTRLFRQGPATVMDGLVKEGMITPSVGPAHEVFTVFEHVQRCGNMWEGYCKELGSVYPRVAGHARFLRLHWLADKNLGGVMIGIGGCIISGERPLTIKKAAIEIDMWLQQLSQLAQPGKVELWDVYFNSDRWEVPAVSIQEAVAQWIVMNGKDVSKAAFREYFLKKLIVVPHGYAQSEIESGLGLADIEKARVPKL